MATQENHTNVIARSVPTKQSAVLVPQLRFPAFDGEWEKKKLGDIGKVKMCKRIFSNQTTEIGDIPFFKIGTFGKEADAYITEELYLEFKSKYSFPKIGDILMSASGTLGRTVVYDGVDAYFQDSNIVWLDNNEELVTNEFLFYIYQIVRYDSEGGTIQRLYNSIISAAKFCKPSLKEQQKIATFLTAVDDKISQLTSKKEQLRQYKKGVMQQLFSQQLRFQPDSSTTSSKQPSLREGTTKQSASNENQFPDWEEKRLGEICTFLKGKGLPKSEIDSSGVFRCIHYGELFLKYGEVIKNIISKTNLIEGKILSKTNDILMPTSDVTPNGLATASCLNEDKVILGGDILIIRQKRQVIDGVFFSYYVSGNPKGIMRLVSGSTVYHLYGSDMKTLKINLPSLKEQQKIASYLSALDDKIEAVQLQIEQTQEFKKGLLQQLFV